MCKPQATTEQSCVFKMCVGPFQDRTAKRQVKDGSQREQSYMSNGGFGLSGREGLALPGRLECKERDKNTQNKNDNRKREGVRQKKQNNS